VEDGVVASIDQRPPQSQLSFNSSHAPTAVVTMRRTKTIGPIPAYEIVIPKFDFGRHFGDFASIGIQSFIERCLCWCCEE
jgi:hypothetical protein